MTLQRAAVPPLLTREEPRPARPTPRAVPPVDVPVAIAMARDHRDDGDLEGARRILETVIARAPENATAWHMLATVYRTWGMSAAALGAMQSALSAAPEHPEWLLEIAHDQARLGLVADAEETLQQAARVESLKSLALATHALMQNPNLLRSRLRVAQGLSDLGMPLQALDVLSFPTEKAEHRRTMALKRASLLRRIGRLDEAREALQEALAEGAPSWDWWREAFEIDAASGSERGIAEALERATGATPRERAELDRLRGILAEWRWQIDEAAQHYQSAAAHDRQDARAYEALARLSLTRFDVRTTRHQVARVAALQAQDRSRIASQLLDAYVEDPDALQRVVETHARTPQKRLYPFVRLARAKPDSTAAALAVLLALRQAGCFDALRLEPATRRIPRRIVQFWDAPLPPEDVAGYVKSWQTGNPGFRHALFDDARARTFLAEACGPEVLDAYARAPDAIAKSDLFRLAYVHVRGGYYASADDVCRLPIVEFVPEGATFVGWQGDYAAIGNNFFGAVARNPIVGLALQQCVEALNAGTPDSRWLATGPGLVSRALIQVMSQAEQPLQGLVILDRPVALQGIAMRCFAGYKGRK